MAKVKAVTRYGPRYGRTVRERVANAESGYKGKQKCPHCGYTGVKRESAGIWNCNKCGAKFTSKAYHLKKPTPLKSKTEELDV